MLNKRSLPAWALSLALLASCTSPTPDPADAPASRYSDTLALDAERLGRAAPSLRALPADRVKDVGVYIVEVDEHFHGLDTVPTGPLGRQALSGWISKRRLMLTDAKLGMLSALGVSSKQIVYGYDTLPAMALSLDGDALWALLAQPGVQRIHAAQTMVLTGASAMPYMGIGVDGNGINADSDAGSGTTVAVIDAAARYWEPWFGSCGTLGNPQVGGQGCNLVRITNHTDCARLTQIDPAYECAPGGGTYDTVAEEIDHGTNVTAIVRNTAPGASVWMLNVAHWAQLKSNTAIKGERLTTAEILDALNTINGDPMDVASINMSLGAPTTEGDSDYCSGPLSTAMRDLWHQRGIVSVVSSGNDGNKNALSSPACEPYAISVGAQYDTQNVGGSISFGPGGTTCNEQIEQGAVTCFSNSQGALDVVAPGSFVQAGGVELGGTSQAAPHVAALAAMLQSDARNGAQPRTLAPHEIVGRLRAQALNLSETAQGQDNQTYTWTHRRVSLTGGIAPGASFDFHTDPDGLTIGASGEQTLVLDTSDFVAREGSVAGRDATDIWLDIEIAHPDASGLELTLTAPDGTSRILAGASGANINTLFGVQQDVSFKDAFDGRGVQGQWSLRIRNTGTQTATLYRALLHTQSTEGVNQPSTFRSFGLDETSIQADGSDLQTFRLVLNDGETADDVRFLLNHPWHTENGRTYDGYFQITPTTCAELGAGLGNEDVAIDALACERNTAPDGSVEFVVRFAAEPSFGVANNNHVSIIWYESGVPRSSWLKVTGAGNGFDVEEGSGPQPSTFRSFTVDEASIQADGSDLQTLRLTLNDGAAADDVRFLLNHPWHTENGRTYDGYFQITPTTCAELGAGLGNEDVAIDALACERNTAPDGSVEFVVRFAAEPSFGVANNNHVSVLWYEGAVARSSWLKVTNQGAGFDVEEGSGPQPSTFRSFGFDETSIQADGSDLQTFRLVLNDGAAADDVRFLLNHPWHTENGRTYDGYFQITPTTCAELGAGLGNEDVAIDALACERNTAPDGSVEFVVRFAAEPSFGVANNNHVSIIWYESGVPRSTWLKVTGAGAGFDVEEGSGPQPSTFRSFGFDEASIQADGSDLQTFRLVLNDGETADDVRFLLNHPWHTENGRTYDGYFQITPTTCTEFGAGLGNEDMILNTLTCERNIASDGAVEFVVRFAAEPSFGAANNNHVSIIWYESGVARSSWLKVTGSGNGFDIQ